MRFQKISDKGSIVLIGSFNPQIFQPFWFSNNKLLQNNEVEIAEIEVISRDITSFGIPWLKVQVFLEKFLAITGEESQFLPLRDFVIGTFHLLGHTPIRQMGINRDIQFEMASESDWHKVGNKLAPKDLWGTLLPSPGMKTLIIDSKRDDEYNGLVNITVRPVLEKKFSENKNIVEISYNSHFNFELKSSAESVLRVIDENFEKTMLKAKKLSESIIHECIKEE